MSPTKPPVRGPKTAGQGGNDAHDAHDPKANPWASYDDADDWSITGDRPKGRADPTSQLHMAPSRGAKAGQPVGTPVMLRVVQGGDGNEAGQTFEVVKSPTSLGRGNNNDVVLGDASISRNHATLELRGQSWHVVDQNSGNGVFVRGKRVPEAPLALGDALALGQVHLRLEAMAAPTPSAPGKKRQPAPIKGVSDLPSAVSEVVAPGRAGVGGQGKSSPQTAPSWLQRLRGMVPGAQGAASHPAPRWRRAAFGAAAALVVAFVLFGRAYLKNDQESARCFALCAQGIKDFGAQRWDDAEQAFADALTIRPHHSLSKRYQGALLVARRDAALLQDAKERRERGDFQQARAALGTLEGTPFVESAWAEAGRYGAAITQVAMQAETALGAGLIAEAHSLLESLGDKAPPRPDLAALNRWSALRTSYGTLEAAAHAQSLRAKAIPSLWEQAQTQSPAMRSAIGLFRSGSAVAGPARALGRMRAPKTATENALVAALKRFVGLYETAVVEHRGKRAFAAIKLFGEARAEAVKVAGDNSRPARDIDGQMADMYYVLGVQGLMAGHLAEASEALHTAVRLRPGHSLSLRRLDELTERADRMVDEAAFLGAGHATKAQELLRQVVEAMPADAPVYGRARKLLRTLDGDPAGSPSEGGAPTG